MSQCSDKQPIPKQNFVFSGHPHLTIFTGCHIPTTYSLEHKLCKHRETANVKPEWWKTSMSYSSDDIATDMQIPGKTTE